MRPLEVLLIADYFYRALEVLLDGMRPRAILLDRMRPLEILLDDT